MGTTNLPADDGAGAVHRLLTAAGHDDPYPSYRRLREIGPVRYDHTLDTYLVLRHSDCAAVLTDPGIRTPGPAWLDGRQPGWRDHSAAVFLYHSLLRRNPPEHTPLRRVLQRALPARPVLGPAVDRVLDSLAARDCHGAPIDLQDTVAGLLPAAVMGGLVGVPPADQRWLRSAVDDLVAVLDPLLEPAVRARADRAADRLGEYFGALVDKRAADPRDDTASSVAAARRDGTLSPEEARDALLLLFAAGLETTSGLIGNAIHAALWGGHRSADPAALVAETLRWDPPVQLTERVAGAGCRIGATTLRPGAGITLVLGSANRDPHRFGEPDRFDPARTDRDHLSFGAGRHYCLGAGLARRTATLLLDRFLTRFPGARDAGPPARRPSLTLRRFTSLPVTLD
jgi:cytochrome P450